MEENHSMGENELSRFINTTVARHLNIPQLLKVKYSLEDKQDLETLNKQLHQIQLQKFHDLYNAFKKHR